jgi:hypothetical protein
VASQTERRFAWFLAMSPALPGWFTRAARRAAPDAIPVYFDGASLYPDWSRLIGRFIRPGVLISSRLDSDDMIHRRFVEWVGRSACMGRGSFVIDFPEGFRLRLPDLECRRVGEWTWVRSRPSHFLSLVEAADRRVTRLAYWRPHSRMGERLPVLRLKGTAWVEICHGLNAINKPAKFGRRVDWRAVETMFC